MPAVTTSKYKNVFKYSLYLTLSKLSKANVNSCIHLLG